MLSVKPTVEQTSGLVTIGALPGLTCTTDRPMAIGDNAEGIGTGEEGLDFIAKGFGKRAAGL
jgi:hypothetical protein